MMDNPYRLPEPSVVSFSGGRTSGFMLWNVMQEFGGSLPDGVKVIFCNTGKERLETLDFVERCSQRWDVPIVWLEYRYLGSLEHGFAVVDFASASRNGEPFGQLNQHRLEYRTRHGKDMILPNPVQRYCTTELKIRTCQRYVRGVLGWDRSWDAIGLRADEPNRVARMRQKRETKVEKTLFGDEKTVTRAASNVPGFELLFPIHDAGHTVDHVMDFWGRQPFDLELQQHQGNCDACFLKSMPKILSIFRERPDLAEWWIEQERATGAKFRNDRPSYAELLAIANGEKEEPGWLWADMKGGLDDRSACEGPTECHCTD